MLAILQIIKRSLQTQRGRKVKNILLVLNFLSFISSNSFATSNIYTSYYYTIKRGSVKYTEPHNNSQKTLTVGQKNIKKIVVGIPIHFSKRKQNFTTIEVKRAYNNQIKTEYPFIFPRFGRNEACICGSGRKFKICCGSIQNQ